MVFNKIIKTCLAKFLLADIVFGTNKRQWQHDGVFDDVCHIKHQSTTASFAMHDSKNFHGTIRLLATVGEEVGEYGSKQLTDLGYVDDADGLLIGEPCNLGIMYAHKGSLNYKLVSKGSAAHSSMPELGSNAIEHLNVAMTQISQRISEQAEKFENPTLGKTFHNITLIKGGVQVNSIPDYANTKPMPVPSQNLIIKP